MNAIETEIFEDADQIARYTAGRFVEIVGESVNQRGRCVVALAGGSTPRRLYQLLASDEFRDRIPWDQVHLFLGDERYVPNDHAESNYRMAEETLISQVPIPQTQVHPVATHREPIEAAREYEEQIRTTFGASEGDIPAFDLILLGIGGDAHTASLFPGTAALEIHDRLVIENWVPQLDTMRITFTIPLLHAARNTILMAAGTDKAEAVERAVSGPADLHGAPSQTLREARGKVTFAIDTDAAARLTRS